MAVTRIHNRTPPSNSSRGASRGECCSAAGAATFAAGAGAAGGDGTGTGAAGGDGAGARGAGVGRAEVDGAGVGGAGVGTAGAGRALLPAGTGLPPLSEPASAPPDRGVDSCSF